VRHLARVAEQDRPDDPAAREHELPVAERNLVGLDDDLVGRRVRLNLPDRGEINAGNFEHGHRHGALVGGRVLEHGRLSRDPRLLHGRGPETHDLFAELDDIAGREYLRVARAHVLVDDHAASGAQSRLPRQLETGGDPGGDDHHIRLRRAPICECDPFHPAIVRDSRGLGVRPHHNPKPCEVTLEHPPGPGVELAAQQMLGTLQDRRSQPEFVQGIGRLESKQPAAGDYRPARPVDLGKRADLERVVGGVKSVRARYAPAGDRGNVAAAAHSQNQAVVLQLLAGPQQNTAGGTVDRFSARVEPLRDPARLTPGAQR
jgi:hypothetical protein